MESKKVSSSRKKAIKKGVRVSLRSMIFFLCFAGFGYQSAEFLAHFLTYPTVMNIEMERPDKFMMPTYTICNLYPVRRTAFCGMFPHKCEKRNGDFCERKPKLCTFNKSETDFVIPRTVPIITDMKSREEFEKVSESRSRFFFDVFNVEKQIHGPYPLNDSDNTFISCFTKYSRYDNDLEPEYKEFKELSETFLDDFTLEIDETEFSIPELEPSALIYVHSPLVGTKLTFKSVLLKKGVNYKIHIKLEEERLLKQPYKTDCRDYEEDWRKNNRTGTRSREMCESQCQADFDLQCYGCLKTSLPLGIDGGMCKKIDTRSMPGQTPFPWEAREVSCGLEERRELLQIRKECKSSCKRECVNRKYIFSIEEMFKRPNIDTGRKDYSYVMLVVDNPEILVISHSPQYMDVELFSFIGGFIGCWLGISVWASAEIIGSILLKIKKILVRRKKEKRLRRDSRILSNGSVALTNISAETQWREEQMSLWNLRTI